LGRLRDLQYIFAVVYETLCNKPTLPDKITFLFKILFFLRQFIKIKEYYLLKSNNSWRGVFFSITSCTQAPTTENWKTWKTHLFKTWSCLFYRNNPGNTYFGQNTQSRQQRSRKKNINMNRKEKNRTDLSQLLKLRYEVNTA